MKIDEAIRLLRSDIDNPGSVDIQDLNQAEQLGIEALGQFVLLRKAFPIFMYALLPGETEA